MGNNGNNKIGEIILESHYMDRGILELEKKDDVVCWGEWQDIDDDGDRIFSRLSLEEIPKYLERVKDTNGKSLINSIENQQTDENSCENCDESSNYWAEQEYCDGYQEWAQHYWDDWFDSHNR